MTSYIAVEVYTVDEILMALLSAYDFDAFHEEESYFVGYISKTSLDEATATEIKKLIESYKVDYKIYEVENQNWNAIWEASFQPVIVEDFCQVRADFHPAEPNIQYDIIINPKMAFGTGHHATTYMMIQLMSGIDFKEKSVFDFGCGTGILAILASKMGAPSLDAIDIEHEAYLNSLENATINHTENIQVFEGDLNQMPKAQYDVILANINRNILLKYAPTLAQRLKSQGKILLSGILNDDAALVKESFEKQNLQFINQIERDNWVCIQFEKVD